MMSSRKHKLSDLLCLRLICIVEYSERELKARGSVQVHVVLPDREASISDEETSSKSCS